MSPEPDEKKRPAGSLVPVESERPDTKRPEDVGMGPGPGRVAPRAPVEEPRFEADLEPQETYFAAGAYPLTDTEGDIAGQRGAQNLDNVGPAKGPAEMEDEETEEAGARRGVRP